MLFPQLFLLWVFLWILFSSTPVKLHKTAALWTSIFVLSPLGKMYSFFCHVLIIKYVLCVMGNIKMSGKTHAQGIYSLVKEMSQVYKKRILE